MKIREGSGRRTSVKAGNITRRYQKRYLRKYRVSKPRRWSSEKFRYQFMEQQDHSTWQRVGCITGAVEKVTPQLGQLSGMEQPIMGRFRFHPV